MWLAFVFLVGVSTFLNFSCFRGSQMGETLIENPFGVETLAFEYFLDH